MRTTQLMLTSLCMHSKIVSLYVCIPDKYRGYAFLLLLTRMHARFDIKEWFGAPVAAVADAGSESEKRDAERVERLHMVRERYR